MIGLGPKYIITQYMQVAELLDTYLGSQLCTQELSNSVKAHTLKWNRFHVEGTFFKPIVDCTCNACYTYIAQFIMSAKVIIGITKIGIHN